MKTAIRFTLLLPLLLTASLPSLRAEPVQQQTLDRLLMVSGLAYQVRQLPTLILEGLAQARAEGGRISDEKYAVLRNAAATSYRAERLLRDIRDNLLLDLSEEQAQLLMEWYTREPGASIVQAEMKASSPEAYQRMMEDAQTLLSDDDRLDLAGRIDQLISSSKTSTQLQKQTSMAVFRALAAKDSTGSLPPLEEVEANIDARLNEARLQIRRLTVLSLLNAYRDVPLADIKAYVAFLERPETDTFITSTNQGMLQAFDRATGLLEQYLQQTDQP